VSYSVAIHVKFKSYQHLSLPSVSVAMSCDYLFSSFVPAMTNKGASHSPATALFSAKSAERSERQVQPSLDKFAIPSAVLATCLNLSAVLLNCSRLILLLFRHAFRRSRIRVILFCNLIGAVRIQAPEVNGLNPPMLPGSFLPRAGKRK